MSVSKWRYTEECNGRPCPGDCDHCSFEPKDLISREDAIELLTKIVFDEPPYLDSETLCRIYAEEQINKIPSAEAVQGEWIPCSERLPSEDGEYLVFYEGTIIGSCIEIMWYGEPLMPNVDVSGKHFYRSDSEWGDIIYDEVIAWMPLPKPYREDGV